MNAYLIFKALHLIAVISWMAGLLYLPRIFVYHSETLNNKGQQETFKIMEKRLFFTVWSPYAGPSVFALDRRPGYRPPAQPPGSGQWN
mgnify:CR=1 FL=1